MIKKIGKCILGYMLFYFWDMIIVSALLFKYRCDVSINFNAFLYYQFIGKNIEIKNCTMTGIIYFIHNIAEISAVAVLTSYIFAYVLNREPKIIFPDKLVIRHRTSWEAKNKITLGILIGNKNRYNIHNAICSITCSYIKQENPLLINSEFT